MSLELYTFPTLVATDTNIVETSLKSSKIHLNKLQTRDFFLEIKLL